MPATKTQARYGVRWFDGLEWVGPFASLTKRQAMKEAESTAKDGTAVKVVEIKAE